MKTLRVLMVCGALLAAGCALPLGEDYLITRDGSANVIYITDYSLLNYVPIPDTGERPVILVDNRGDLEATVAWKHKDGSEVPQPFEVFAANTEYKAEIRISAKPGYGFYPSTPFTYPAGKINSQAHDLGDPIRTITVVYNNSDDADITFITDYNLQNYVPVPMADERPVRAVDTRGDLSGTVEWKTETTQGSDTFDNAFSGDKFVLDTVYQAEIRLEVKSGYRFSAVRNFAYADGTPAIPQGSGSDPNVRSFIVKYRPTQTPAKITDDNLTPHVPKPLIGTTAITSFAASQYSGIITWKNTETQAVLTGPFESNTAYTAEVVLSPVSGYTVTGITNNFFKHTGAETIVTNQESGVITIGFSRTGSFAGPIIIYDFILTGRLPKPVIGMTPVTGITGAQYSGSVTWIPYHSAFQENTAYKAVLTLNAASGYTFIGIGQNVFRHEDAVGTVTNLAGSGTVTITFPPTASATYKVITSFGPVTTETSALWMMRELKDDTYPLVIDLPDDEIETIEPDSITLFAGSNSPATVIINGHQRTLKIDSTGTLITVGGGVTLTLQDIILDGYDDNTGNTAPLVVVNPGGMLVLGSGAVLTGNKSTGNVGGVWVNGGTLVLNNGGVIKNMSASSPNSGGGVRVEPNGKIIMNGGTIGTSAEGNTVTAANSGGGVFVAANGTVDMAGGTIKFNQASGPSSGGGVYFEGASYNHVGGLITENTASGANSGDVYLTNTGFKMSKNAKIDKVFLAAAAAVIVDDTLVSDPPNTQVANITFDPSSSKRVLGAATEFLVKNKAGLFLYNGVPITSPFSTESEPGGFCYVLVNPSPNP